MRSDGALELEQDLDFQRRVWRVQRIGWIVMALLVVAGLAGLTGHGPMAKASAGAAEDGLVITYDRLTRYETPARLALHVAPGVAASDSTVAVWINRDFVNAMQIGAVVPTPVEAQAAGDGVIYTFRVADPRRSAVIERNGGITIVPRDKVT